MRKYGLCIGINDYPGTGMDLRGCVNDAKDWTAALSASGFEVTTLLDASATKRRIMGELEELRRKARAGDSVIVTFSGHGSFIDDVDGDEDDGIDECWCPHDVFDHQITDDELHHVISRRAEDVRWVLISDSCHSGTISRYAPITTPPTTEGSESPQRLVRFLPPSIFFRDSQRLGRLDAMQKGAKRTTIPGRRNGLAISGCQDNEYSYDAWFNGRANGAFTYVALESLRSLPAGANYEDWHREIRRVLPSQQYAQAPNLTGSPDSRVWPVFSTTGSAPSVAGGAAMPSSAGEPEGDPLRMGREIGRALYDERQRERAGMKRARGAAGIPVAAIGDSWFDYPRNDIKDLLEDDYGYDVESVAVAGARIEDMAYGSGQLRKLLRRIEKMIRRGEAPRAILLSGGGNDVAGDEFAELLNHRSSPQWGLNPASVDGAMNRIRDSFLSIIGSVDELMIRETGARVPIVTHGYDYAVPDGRGFLGGWWFLPGPWLRPALEKKGFTSEAEMRSIVSALIDRFNEMQRELIQARGLDHVHHVELRGELPTDANYKEWWANELHPTQTGFDIVTRRFSLVLDRALRN